jgi:hypothetical protein
MQFQVYYGEGSVLYGPYGADLSGFRSTMKMVDRPLERSFSSILKWLERGFRVNPNTHFVSVDCLVSFEVEGDDWELMRINNTEE